MDEIRIGDTELRFELAEEAVSAADRREAVDYRHRAPARGQRGLALRARAAVRGRRRHGRRAGRRGRLADRGRGARGVRRRRPGAREQLLRTRRQRQRANLRARAGRLVPFGDGHDADRGAAARRRAQHRPRRRQPRLRLPRRRAQADHQRPLAGRGAAPPGQAHPRPGRRASAALGDHPGARPRAQGRGRHDDLPREARRRLPALLRRAHDDARRRGSPRSSRRGRDLDGRARGRWSRRPTTAAAATTSPSSCSGSSPEGARRRRPRRR